jgi:hypothetical protein
MARETIEIAGEVFRTQAAAKERIQAIMARYPNGAAVDMFDLAFLQELLERHPDAPNKIGCGVASIYVNRNPIYPSTRTFFLVRTDNSTTDFSYLECIRPTPHRKKVLRALRAAVEPYTLQVKQAFFDQVGSQAICPITGETIRFIGSHVDHTPPATFDAIAAQFLAEENLLPDDIGVVAAGDHIFQDRLTDQDLERRWVDFHNSRAVLRVISKTANLSNVRYEGGGYE